MSGTLLLLLHSLRRARTLVLAMGALLGAFQVVLILVARSIQRTGGFDQLVNLLPLRPGDDGPFARQLHVVRGYCLPGLFSSIRDGIAAGALHCSSHCANVRNRDGLYRFDPVASAGASLDRDANHRRETLLCLAAVLCLMMAGTWAGLYGLAPTVRYGRRPELMGSLALNLGLLMLCWAGIAAAIGSASRRRSVAGAFAGLLALAAFLLDYVGRLWQTAEKAAWLSPFRTTIH